MRIEDYDWHHVFALVVLFFLLAIYTVLSVFGWTEGSLAAVTLSVWSMRHLLLVPLLLIVFKAKRRWVWGAMLLPILLCFIWQIASLELYAVQYRFFSFAELHHLLGDAETRPLIFEQLLSWRLLFVTALFYGVFFGCAEMIKKYISIKWNISCLALFVVVILTGEFLSTGIDRTDAYAHPERLCVMPWSALSLVNQGHPVARENVARKYWYDADPSFWKPEPPSYADLLQPKYQGRSIVVVLLESHGLTYMDEYGKGSLAYKPSSPYLSKLASEQIFFKNYFQSGYATVTCEWSLLGSFPYFNEFAYTPRLARLGLIPEFQSHGYQCEWLRSATPLFGNLNELLDNLDIMAGPSDQEKDEKEQLDDTLWSSWGMPDDQLYDIAFQHIVQRLENEKNPFLQFVLSVSNHNPFHLPAELNGVRLQRSHAGGMRYADACLETFMKNIQSIELAQRPIVFITADTGFRSYKKFIKDTTHLGEPLESLRIPGVLVLPDYEGPGKEITDLFSHEDVLPLLAAMTGVESPITERMRSYKREAVAVSDYDGHTIMTTAHQYYGSRSLMAIENYWNLSALIEDAQKSSLMSMRVNLLEEMRLSTWINAGNDVYNRDFRWDLIDSYAIPSDPLTPACSSYK